MHLARQPPIGPVRRDEAGDGDAGAVGEELRDFGDAPDVFRAVGGGEAEVAVQAEADVVAVEAVGGEGVVEEVLFEGGGDGGFAGGGEAGQPDCEAGLVAERGAFGVREGGVPCYVAGLGGRVSRGDGRGGWRGRGGGAIEGLMLG